MPPSKNVATSLANAVTWALGDPAFPSIGWTKWSREKRDRHRDISGVHHMPGRHTTYRLTLTPATEAELLRMKECGENKQLLSRCALWGSSDALEALIVLWKRRYPYQVGQDGEWGECIFPGAWQAIEFDDAQWRAVAVMQGAWVRDWTQQGRRTDFIAQAEPLPAPPFVRCTSRLTQDVLRTSRKGGGAG